MELYKKNRLFLRIIFFLLLVNATAIGSFLYFRYFSADPGCKMAGCERNFQDELKKGSAD
jgi:hypothetical protein